MNKMRPFEQLDWEPSDLVEFYGIWKSVNEPNLVQNVLPTRARAHLILQKGAEHTVEQVLLRKN